MHLTRSEIAELKTILAARKTAKAKPAAPASASALLVGPHGRVMGRVAVPKGAKPPARHKFIPDDTTARVGDKVVRDKVVKASGETSVYLVMDKGGEIVNRILARADDLPKLPKGYSLAPECDTERPYGG